MSYQLARKSGQSSLEGGELSAIHLDFSLKSKPSVHPLLTPRFFSLFFLDCKQYNDLLPKTSSRDELSRPNLPGNPGRDVTLQIEIEVKDPLPFQTCSLYRGNSLIRNRHPVGPYSRTMPRILLRS